MSEVTHACPPEGSGVTPCCGKTPFELPATDRLTLDAWLVDCDEPSARALGMVGTRVTLEENGHRYSGRCIGVERTHSTIADIETGGRWPGVRFELLLADGRSHWTPTYPDDPTGESA